MIARDVVNTLNLVTSQQEEMTRLDPSNVRTGPGVLSSMPGVIADTDGSGQMHVRGGRPDQIGWYVEGIPITDPNTGMFGTNLYTTGMSKFQSYTGGFAAEYGNAISGVLNEVKKTGADMPGAKLSLEGGGESYRNTYAELGGGPADQFNYYAGASLQRTDLDAPLVKQLEYADSVAKLVWPSKATSITVLAMQGSLAGKLDAYHDTGDNSLSTPHEKDYMDQRYALTAVTWSHNFSPKSFMTIRPYYARTDIAQNLVGTYGMYADISSARTGLEMDYTNQVNRKHLLKFGGSYMSSDNNYYLYYGFPFYKADVNTAQTGMYLQDQVKLSDKWTADLGLRQDAMTYHRTGREYVASAGYSGAEIPDVTESRTDPRFGLAYASNDRTVWKASWGKYTKFVPSSSVQKTYFTPDMTFGPTPTLEQMYPGLGATAPQESTSMELSYERQMSDSWALRITPFLTTYANLGDTYLDATTGASTYSNLGEGKSSGLEVYLRKKMSANWQGWLSYTYQKTKANRADLGMVSDMYYTSWDQRHTLSLVTDYKVGRCSHSLRADFGSGRADRGDPLLQQRANPSFVVSYNLTVKLPKGSSLGESVYLNVFNLLGNRQTMQYRWDPGPVRVQDSWTPARFISLGVSSAY
jgi:outer membrane cobalamin receptor